MSENPIRRFEERRLHLRYVCTSKTLCELSLRSGRHFFAVADLSEGGMRIKSPDAGVLEEFRIDSAVRILSGECEGTAQDLAGLTGRVVWVRVEQGHVQVGIEFDTPLDSRLDFLLGVLQVSGQDSALNS